MSPLHSLFTSKTRQAKETKTRQREAERNGSFKSWPQNGPRFLIRNVGGEGVQQTKKKKHYVLIIEILCLNNSI